MLDSERPLIIIGAGRGGTSILAACLGGHPRVAMTMEYMSTALLIGEDFPIRSTASLIDERLAAFRAACEAEAVKHPGKIWANKITSEQVAGLEAHNLLNRPAVDVAERFVSAMANYRIVYILRHGASCIDSKVRRTGQPLVTAALKWCYSADLFERLTALGAVAGSCKYEDLVANPRETLTALCGDLGLDFDERMLEQTDSGTLREEYRHGRFLEHKATDIPDLSPDIAAMITPWLERLGYAN